MFTSKWNILIVTKFMKFTNSKLRNICTSASKCNITLKYSPNALTNKKILGRYLKLPMPECFCLANYVWIDGTGERLRSKMRTLEFIPKDVQELPVWMYDGSLTFQADIKKPDIYLCPRAMYCDPIRRGNNRLVLCDTYDSDHKHTKTNHRFSCQEAMDCAANHEPWFGLEQEFTFIDVDGRPLGWPSFGYPPIREKYHCGVGAFTVVAREIVEAHYRACLYAGILICGLNAAAMPSQWKFQIGPSVGMRSPDDMWMARYLLLRIAEEYGVGISFHPKPVDNWKGAGAHANFSTKATREENGLKTIEQLIQKLSSKHKEHMVKYDPKGGLENKKRLNGKGRNSHFDKFTSGVSIRNVSIRIPRSVADAKKGHLEDRRPAANSDPYLVCDSLIRTCLLP